MRNRLPEILQKYASEKNLDSLDETEEKLTPECENRPLTKILDSIQHNSNPNRKNQKIAAK